MRTVRATLSLLYCLIVCLPLIIVTWVAVAIASRLDPKTDVWLDIRTLPKGKIKPQPLDESVMGEEPEIQAIESDVQIRVDGHYLSLTDLLKKEMDFTETVMCKENAEEVYELKLNLELIADDIQRWFDKWKDRDFQKTSG